MKTTARGFVKNIYLGLGLISLVALQSAHAAEDLKIGTVDMQKALQTVDAGKKARTQLEKEFNTRKKDLQTEEAAIKKMSDEFKKQSLVMSDEARGKKQAEIQERIIKFQEMTNRSQQEIQLKERDLTQPIITKIRTLISEMAKKKGYSIVLEKNENTVLFSQEKDDLTSEVITAYDKLKS